MMRVTTLLALLSVLCGLPAAAETLRHPLGFSLTVGAGRRVAVTERGFLVTLPDNAERRDPVTIAIDLDGTATPWWLWSCGPDFTRYRCRTTREPAPGSSGDAVTLTVFASFGDTTVHFRQVKHADGPRPVFELLLWLETGDLVLERAP
ncbi:Tsi3 family protein [Phreatobacter sp. AB_2022a]|uniref:Tsi3 family protein n=1 Tax=Phreatobacter sp. AB_2022a TaxID=3003134 RepID=UPI00228749BC|nr:Tsi3 family protein [Phreatobacter sp. AB_2022a]MCZ0732877.1 Tsi3 family protein [Phreatobacter sp. AB_2022a]